MKIRWWIALLLLNVTTLAWQWDAFARWGWGPNVQREPERLRQQIKPEALQFTLPSKGATVSSPSPALPASEDAAPPAGNAAQALLANPIPTAVAPSGAASVPLTKTPVTATQTKPASN